MTTASASSRRPETPLRVAQSVNPCGCIPPIPETQAYVADIPGLLHGAGDPLGDGASALEVRFVR